MRKWKRVKEKERERTRGLPFGRRSTPSHPCRTSSPTPWWLIWREAAFRSEYESAVRVRGKRRACAIAGGLPCRRTRRSSMSEYRPGVTSPHTLSQHALPLPPFSFHPDVPHLTALLTRSAPLCRLPPRPTRSSTPTSQRTSNVALLRYPHPFIPCVPTRFLSVAPATSFYVILFSHYLGPSCLRCPSVLASFLSSFIPGRRRFLTPRGYSRSPSKCSPQIFPSVSAVLFTPFCSDWITHDHSLPTPLVPFSFRGDRHMSRSRTVVFLCFKPPSSFFSLLPSCYLSSSSLHFSWLCARIITVCVP